MKEHKKNIIKLKAEKEIKKRLAEEEKERIERFKMWLKGY